MDWHKCFKRFDTDKSGCISSDELHTALISFGYNISKKMAELLVKRFDRANKNEILFDDFIRCCLILYVSHMPRFVTSVGDQNPNDQNLWRCFYCCRNLKKEEDTLRRRYI